MCLDFLLCLRELSTKTGLQTPQTFYSAHIREQATSQSAATCILEDVTKISSTNFLHFAHISAMLPISELKAAKF